MKRIKLFVSLALVAVVAVSCAFDEVDLGYPDTITFSADGGAKSVKGAAPFSYASIVNYKSGEQGRLIPSDDDRYKEGIMQVEFGWLSVEHDDMLSATELRIVAKPNTTGKQRRLSIELYSGCEYHVITVVQQK